MIQIKKYFYHFDLLSFYPLSFDPLSFDPVSFDFLPFDPMSFDPVSFDPMSVNQDFPPFKEFHHVLHVVCPPFWKWRLMVGMLDSGLRSYGPVTQVTSKWPLFSFSMAQRSMPKEFITVQVYTIFLTTIQVYSIHNLLKKNSIVLYQETQRRGGGIPGLLPP